MIKFFRKIRHSLLSENKFTKYLFYAIGEIALVMIGILLALQVNNWNEIRKGQKFEQGILFLLDQNLESDSTLISKELFKSKLAIELTNRLLDQVSQKNYNDSLNFWMGKIISFERFKSKSSAFEVLKSKGIDNISDKKLQILLMSYYDESLLQLDESLHDVLNSFNMDWIPVVKQEFSDFKWQEYLIPNDPKAFFEEPTTKVLFKLYKDNRAGQVRKMESALSSISEIRKQIKLNIK
jgi:hypothetical protein